MMDEIGISQIKIERPLYEHEQLRTDLGYEKPQNTFWDFKFLQQVKLKRFITTTVPVFHWLKHYKWKSDIVPDLISGFTVAIMHIPQGMAYALLANVPPIVGIYMAFFPVLVYFFLGTSKHNSMGTFAVICLMTGKSVLEHSDPYYFRQPSPNPQLEPDATIGYSPIQVASTVTFVVAIFQLIMYGLRLGAVSALLSETLVSGFTTGAAIQVFSSQLKDLFGISIPKFKGNFVVYNTVYALIESSANVNYAAVIISAITISISSFNNEVLKPIVAKKSVIPIPIELIAVLLGSLISRYYDLSRVYNITTIGDIPTGLPSPALPQFSLIPDILVDGITIAIVSYTITLSMGFIFAQKLKYEVDANQELLAMGMSNVVGSLFSCAAVCASLSRSLIQQVVGGRTQVASVVSCSLLIFVLLWIGPFFEPLPKCVLASVIVVALKGMLLQVRDFYKFWKLSRMDALVWLVTCVTVVFVAVDIGLLVGIIMSLITIFFLGFRPHTCLLGSVPHTDIYLDINRYKGIKEIHGIKIFHYSGGINFATRNILKDDLYRLVEINPQKELVYRNKLSCLSESTEELDEYGSKKIMKLQKKVNQSLKCLIMDFSSVSYVDPSGISMLKIIIGSFQQLDIIVYIAGCTDPVYNMMLKCNLVGEAKSKLRTFPCIHDAVLCYLNLHGSESSICTVRL